MNLKIDEKGISPVIGSIMLITIFIIFAGIIAAYIITPPKPPPPEATLEVELVTGPPNYLLVHHNGGEDLKTDDLIVKINGEERGVVWNVEELKFGENAKVHFFEYQQPVSGDNVTIVHEPSGKILLENCLV